MFSPQEQVYLQTQMLARLGTVAPDGQPDVDVVGFQFDGTHFYCYDPDGNMLEFWSPAGGQLRSCGSPSANEG